MKPDAAPGEAPACRRRRSGPAISRPFDILFLCTGNSARSILAEAIMNKVGAGTFVAHSAGSHPKGEVHPQALDLLHRLGYRTAGLRSKSWDEFAAPGAPELDFVITVCDDAAGEVCPIWPGQPMTAHWGIADPAAVEGSPMEVALAFNDAYRVLNNRLGLFASLPFDKLDRLSLKRRMDEIGAKTKSQARA
jgi:protein-tyrosine-phosphatase